MSLANRDAAERWMKRHSKVDNKQNENEFAVKVITHPEAYSGPATVSEDQEVLSKTGIDSKYVFMGRLTDAKMAHHAFLDDPCDSSVSTKGDAIRILHSKVIVSKPGARPSFGVGDIIIVSCEAADGDVGEYDLQTLRYERIQESFRDPRKDNKDITCADVPKITEGKIAANFGSLRGAAGAGTSAWTVGGGGDPITAAKDYTGQKNIIIDWFNAINGHASFNNMSLITGPPSEQVRNIAEAELSKWGHGQLKEGKSDATPMLRAYESLQGLPTNYFPAKPWSAGYIVYLMKKGGTSFDSGASHYKYSRALHKARLAGATSGWSMFSVLEKVKVGVGDVFVKPRPAGHYYSHGDVVYKIEGNIAYLTGGNVGNTAKIAAKLQLNADGTVVSPGPYLVIDKFLG